jgi:hypothetical protein
MCLGFTVCVRACVGVGDDVQIVIEHDNRTILTFNIGLMVMNDLNYIWM